MRTHAARVRVGMAVGVAVLGTVLGAVVGLGPVAAQPRRLPEGPARLVELTEGLRFATAVGFIDDPVASDAGHVVYVVADSASRAEAHVVTVAGGSDQVVDLAPITLHPVALTLLGTKLFVVGADDNGAEVGGLIELSPAPPKAARHRPTEPGPPLVMPAPAIVYRVGPATHVTVITRDGKPRVALHRTVPIKGAKGGTRHEVELLALETGKRVGKPHALELDGNGDSKALELHVNHWADGMTRALGIKAGEWDRKADMRLPDGEATFDLITGAVVDRQPIGDLFEQRRRFGVLADAGGRLDFVAMAWDLSGLQLWRHGRPQPITLDQPLAGYDLKSLQGVVAADGSAWLALKIDPVNAAAVERKKADVEYLDLFHVDASGAATRKGRVLAAGIRHRLLVLGGQPWLVERNAGFDRGGRSLTQYLTK